MEMKREFPDEPSSVHLRYRPDIDGLRAIAVLAVVASHLPIRGLEGGYIGVDLFFVISGYLIGSNLLREVAARGRIDYADFYERRIRRILPALLAMLLGVSAFAYAVFLPKDMLEFAKMGAAALLFSANIFLSHSTGYFTSDAAYNFLTHTWSLGVEEQFYILFPLVLMISRRAIANGKIGTLLSVLAGISFVVSVPSAYFAETGTFYLLPTRTWELLLGTLTYICAPKISQLSLRTQSVLAWIGLVAILVPIVLYSDKTIFPGLTALPPCMGAVLLIATRSTLLHRMLSWRACVFVGQISYSLYLWHWPIIVYNRMYPIWAHGNQHVLKPVLLASMIFVAYLSWRWIETPFRRGRFKPSRTALFWLTGGLAAGELALFFAIVFTHGADFRFSPVERQIASYRQNGGSMQTFRVGKCFLEEHSPISELDRTECLTLDSTRPNYLLIGSSFVAQFHDALQQVYPEIHFLQATLPGCAVQPPSFPGGDNGCPALMHYIFNDFVAHNRVNAVFFQAEPNLPNPNVLASVLDFFHKRGIRVYVMGPQVKYDTPGPALAIAFHRNPQTFEVQNHILNSPTEDQPYRAVTEREGGIYLSMFDTLCPGGHCRILAEPEIPMETDRYHLTYAGTVYVAESWRARSLLTVTRAADAKEAVDSPSAQTTQEEKSRVDPPQY